MSRREDLNRFYKLMNTLKKKTGGRRKLGDCDPTVDPKIGGVYFRPVATMPLSSLVGSTGTESWKRPKGCKLSQEFAYTVT